MIEIDEYARQAVESPVAHPPEMARLRTLANRHRRRRIGLQAGCALGLTSVAVVAIVAVSSISTDESGLHVTVTSPTRPPTTADDHGLTIADLTRDLARAGHRVVGDGTASGSPLADVAHLLCVDGTQVRVYQYADAAARVAVSAGISADGSQIEFPSAGSSRRITLVEWVGPPHFFAKGRIVVLVLQDDEKLLAALERLLGPTVSPRALPQPRSRARCATDVP
jgi:hypothetical protein